MDEVETHRLVKALLEEESAATRRQLLLDLAGLPGLLRNGIQDEVFGYYYRLGLWHVQEGARDLSSFTARMIFELGPAIQPYVGLIWAYVWQEHRRLWDEDEMPWPNVGYEMNEDDLIEQPATEALEEDDYDYIEGDQDLDDEYLSFYEEDIWVVGELCELMRRIGGRDDIKPRDYQALALMMQGLWRLPSPTPGLTVSFTATDEFEESKVTRRIELTEESLKMTSTEVYRGPVGSDWETSKHFDVGTGWREPYEDECIKEWLTLFGSAAVVEADDADLEGPIEWLEEVLHKGWSFLPTDY